MGFMGKELNEWIEIKLRERGWSISELARQADLNNSFVSHVLSGRANPGPKFYQGMARAFDLPTGIGPAARRYDHLVLDWQPR